MRTLRSRFAVALVAGALAVSLAACGGDSGGEADDGGDSATGGGEASATLTIAGSDDLKFDQTSLTAPAGEDVGLTLECGSTVEHDFVIEEAGDKMVAHCEPGGSDSGTFNLEAGEYTFYCSVPGHRQAGMEGTLTVE